MKYCMLVTVLLLLGGCTSTIVKTKAYPTGTNTIDISKEEAGVTYYLPKKLIKLTVTRKKEKLAGIMKKVTDAEKAYANAIADMMKKKKVFELKNAVAAKVEDDDAKKKAKTAAALAAAEFKVALAKVEGAKKKLGQAIATSDILGVKFTKAVKEVAAAKKNYDKAMLDEARKQIALNDAIAAVATATGDDEIKRAKKKAKKAETEYQEAAKKRVTALQTYFNAIDTADTADTASTIFVDSINLDLLPSVPDTSRVFVAQLNHSLWRDDELDISTTESGFLHSAKATETDRTGDIIVEGVKTIVEIAKAVTGIPVPGAPARMLAYPKKEEEKLFPFTYERIFDPSEVKGEGKGKNTIVDINNELKNVLKTKYRLDIKVDQKELGKYKFNKLADLKGKEFEGLVYSRSIPYTITIKETGPDGKGGKDGKDSKDGKDGLDGKDYYYYNKKSSQVMIPNGAPIALLPFEAGPAVTTDYDVEFKNGMLTKRNATRPSELFAIGNIPFEIAKAIVAIPTEFIQLKIDYSSKQEALLKQQKLLLDAREELRKTKEDIIKDQEGTQGTAEEL